MKPTQKTTIIIAISSVLLVVSGGVYAFFFMAMKDKTAKASEVALQASDLENKQGNLSQNLTLLKKSASDIEKINSYFIKESQIVAFTERIESLGKTTGVTITLESLEPTPGKNNTRVLNFRIKASGYFANVMSTLRLLEVYPGKFEFNGVRVYRADGLTTPMPPQKGSVKAAPPLWTLEATITALNFVTE